MKIKTDQYIFPPRPQTAIPRDDLETFATLDWIAQLKYNDSRCLVKYLPDGTIELWNRHAERFRTYTAPDSLIEELHEVAETLGLKLGKLHLLDGGLLDQKHVAIKDTIVIWDILVRDGEHLLGTTYQERYEMLRSTPYGDRYQKWTFDDFNLGIKFTTNIFMPENYDHEDWNKLWTLVDEINAPYTHGKPGDPDYEIKPIIEGIVLKDPEGTLSLGFKERNNEDWMVRSRVQTGRHRF